MSRRLSNLFHSKSKKTPADNAPAGVTASSSTNATKEKKIFPSGIKLLHDSEQSVVDIIFVHGLTGDRERTWTAKNADSSWPQSLLPSKLPNARMLTFGYDAYVANWQGMVSQNRIKDHSGNLLNSIATFREEDDTNNRPIIFVCHSLGGLVCKDALSAADRKPESHLRAIVDSTYAITFIGTPQHGSGLAIWAKSMAVMIGVLKQTNRKILAVLERDSEVLARVQDEFHTMMISRSQKHLQLIKLTCFFEELPLPGVGVVVSKDSAILPGYTSISIHSNHMDMTRFQHEDDPGFVAITGELRRWIRELIVPNEQQQISQDQAASQPIRPVAIPFRRDEDFVDCDIISQIWQKCSLPAARVALVGLGGVGKSQLAIEYSYRVRDSSPTTWTFWVHAGSRARFEEGYKDIADKMKIHGRDDSGVKILQLVKNWLCDEANGRWVMIVDNADDPDVLFKQETDYGLAMTTHCLSDFLPQSPNGSILLTSRRRDVALKFTGRDPDIVTIDPMDEFYARALLHKKLKEHLSKDDDEELVKTLDYMPLAISQAAAYINQMEPRMDISKYVHEFRKGDKIRTLLLQRDAGDNRRDSTASSSIITTWHISFEHIHKERSSAARLLSLMSLFDRQGIPEDLLKEYEDDGDSVADFEEDLSTLRHYSLVKVNVTGDEFEMHRLVQFSMKRWLKLSNELEHWEGKYIDIMDYAFPDGTHENRATCIKLLPHAQMVSLFRPTDKVCLKHWANLVAKTARHLNEIGNYDTAENMYRQVLEVREKLLGREHPKTLTSLNNLSLILVDQGKYEQAEEMSRRALEEREKVLGREHPHTLASVDNLAVVLGKQGKYKQAEEMSCRALEGTEKALGREHPDTLTNVNNLAVVLGRQGKYEQAEKLIRRALEGRENVLGREHPSTLASVYCLAHILHDQNKNDEASILYQRACAGHQKTLGPDHPTTKKCLLNAELFSLEPTP